MLKLLTAIATKLDSLGFTKEADAIDLLLVKRAEYDDFDDEHVDYEDSHGQIDETTPESLFDDAEQRQLNRSYRDQTKGRKGEAGSLEPHLKQEIESYDRGYNNEAIMDIRRKREITENNSKWEENRFLPPGIDQLEKAQKQVAKKGLKGIADHRKAVLGHLAYHIGNIDLIDNQIAYLDGIYAHDSETRQRLVAARDNSQQNIDRTLERAKGSIKDLDQVLPELAEAQKEKNKRYLTPGRLAEHGRSLVRSELWNVATLIRLNESAREENSPERARLKDLVSLAKELKCDMGEIKRTINVALHRSDDQVRAHRARYFEDRDAIRRNPARVE